MSLNANQNFEASFEVPKRLQPSPQPHNRNHPQAYKSPIPKKKLSSQQSPQQNKLYHQQIFYPFLRQSLHERIRSSEGSTNSHRKQQLAILSIGQHIRGLKKFSNNSIFGLNNSLQQKQTNKKRNEQIKSQKQGQRQQSSEMKTNLCKSIKKYRQFELLKQKIKHNIQRQSILELRQKFNEYEQNCKSLQKNKDKDKGCDNQSYLSTQSPALEESTRISKNEKCVEQQERILTRKSTKIYDVPKSSVSRKMSSLLYKNSKPSHLSSQICSNPQNQIVLPQRSLHSKPTHKLLPKIKPHPHAHAHRSHTDISNKPFPAILTKSPTDLCQIKSESYAVMQYPSKKLILSHRSNTPYQIASLTKIMTYYTIRKISTQHEIDIFNQNIVIGNYAMEMSGTSAEILAGEIFSVLQLLYGMMLPSGNDAATALAEWGGKILFKQCSNKGKDASSFQKNINNKGIDKVQKGEDDKTDNIKIFIAQMNKNAKALNLMSTFFSNQHGLPHPDSKSTALDVSKLCCECLSDELFITITSTEIYKSFTYQNNSPEKKRSIVWTNTNKLLRRNGFIGMKTGITVTAGPCLASAYKFRDQIYVCIVLRANKVSRRFKETRKILSWCLQNLYQGSLTGQQSKSLKELKKNKPELDSDYSEDQQQFHYGQMSQAQFQKRANIINYEM